MTETRYRLPLVLFLGGMLVIHAVVAWNSRDLIRKGYPDFTIFYSAGRIVRDGLARDLYNQRVQYRTQQEFASGVTIRQGPLPYNHPPFEALLFLPLTWLPYLPAYLLWDGINLLMLFSLPLLLRPHLACLRTTSVPLGWLAALGFPPVFMALLQGQDIILLLLLLVLSFCSLRRDADFASGCWLALGLFRFHVVLPLFCLLLCQRRWRAGYGFVVIASALIVVSLAVLGWQGTVSYPSYVWHVEQTMERRKTVVPLGMPDLRGLVDTALASSHSKILPPMVIATVSIAVLAATAYRLIRRSPVVHELGFSLGVITSILVGYHAFAYDLSLLLLPVAVVFNYWLEHSAGRAIGFWLFFPIVALFVTPLPMFLEPYRGWYSLVAVVLLLWAWGIAREMAADDPSPETNAGALPQSA
jgi:hypothetical protein